MKLYEMFLDRGLSFQEYENVPKIVGETLIMMWTERFKRDKEIRDSVKVLKKGQRAR